MKEKFTPGDWVALDSARPWDESQKVINICQKDGAKYTVHSSDVCELVVSHDTPSVVRANANLIAAAPEMYRLLEDLSMLVTVMGNNGEVTSEIDELLAKARGEK